MKKRLITILIPILLFPVFLNAGALDELANIPRQFDVLLYADVKSMLDYAREKGINPEDLPYLMGESRYREAEEVLNKFSMKISDIQEILLAGKVEDPKKTKDVLMVIRYGGKTRPIPAGLVIKTVNTVYGPMYSVKEEEQVLLTQTRDSFILGTRAVLEEFHKNRKTAGSKGSGEYGFFRKQSSGKCLYWHVAVNRFMKDSMGNAVKKGEGLGKGLGSNVFLKSVMALQSLEGGVKIGGNLEFHGGMRAGDRQEGERLLMVSHFLIVGSSLAVSFIDLLSRNFGGGAKSAASDEKNMELIQEFFGRIETRKAERGVTLSFQLTGKETDLFVKSARETIGKEKVLRAERLGREALADLNETIRKGDRAKVAAFLDKKVNINGVDTGGETPLNAACGAGMHEIALLLIGRGALVNATGDAIKTPLHRAVESGNLETVKLVLSKGGNVNAKSHNDYTPLHLNAMQGNERITALLIEKQAQVNAKTQNWDTPLHLAAENGYLPIVRILLERGADSEAANLNGERPVDGAVRNNRVEVMNFFQERTGQPSGETDSSGENENDGYGE